MKALHIMRGLPGSGKSTMASNIKSVAETMDLTTSICSADDFRMENGEYVFRNSREPHDLCLAKAKQEMERGVDVVIIDNTNCTNRSMKPYVKMALEYGYVVQFFTIEPVEINILMARGLHAVPRESYERMLRQWVVNPTVEEILNKKASD